MARVLVVDDDAAIRQLLTFAFTMEGHTVETLADGRGVVEALRASSERVIVFMDVMMPHMDGLEVCRQLMEEPALLSRHAVVLMSAGLTPGVATARGSAGDAGQAIQSGARVAHGRAAGRPAFSACRERGAIG